MKIGSYRWLVLLLYAIFVFPILQTTHAQYPLVSQVSYSPDGKYIAASGQILRIWDAYTGDLVLDLPIEDEEEVYGHSWSPDSLRLATVSFAPGADLLRIWQIQGNTYPPGTLLTSLIPTDDTSSILNTVEWHPDGNSIGVGMVDGPVHLYDANTYEWLGVVGPSLTPRFKWNPDPTRDLLLVGTHEGFIIRSYDWTSYIDPVPDRFDPAVGLAWDTTGQLAAIGYLDGPIYIWDTTTDMLKITLPTSNSVGTIKWYPTDNIIIAAGGDIEIWNVETGDLLKTIEASTSLVDISPDGTEIVYGNNDDPDQPIEIMPMPDLSEITNDE